MSRFTRSQYLADLTEYAHLNNNRPARWVADTIRRLTRRLT